MVELYDTTLRDGAQTEGIPCAVQDNPRITERHDPLGIATIEGVAARAHLKVELFPFRHVSLGRRWGMRRSLVLMVCLIVAPLAPAAAQESVSPETFLTMDWQTLETAQGKLNYLGAQEGSISPITFTINGHQLHQGLFEKNALVHERWAESSQPSFTVSVEELLTLLQSSQSLLDGVGPADSWLALTVVVGQPGQIRGFEKRLNREQAKAFLGELWKAFQNRAAHSTLQWWGCALDLLPDGRAADVTEMLEVLVSRFSPNPATGRYAGQVSVRNISQATMPALVSVVFELSGNVQVIDPDGTTCHVEPTGRPYVHAPLSTPEGLPPGETSTIPVSFHNPEHEPVVFTVKILAGPESR